MISSHVVVNDDVISLQLVVIIYISDWIYIRIMNILNISKIHRLKSCHFLVISVSLNSRCENGVIIP